MNFCAAAAADVGAAITAAVTATEQPVFASSAPAVGMASTDPTQPAMPDATDRKRPLETDAAMDVVPQQPPKRPRRRGKGRKNYAALENGDVGSSGEDEGGAAQGRVALKPLRDEDLPRGAADWPQALSKDDRAAQMTLSADRLSVTSRKGYRMVCPQTALEFLSSREVIKSIVSDFMKASTCTELTSVIEITVRTCCICTALTLRGQASREVRMGVARTCADCIDALMWLVFTLSLRRALMCLAIL